MLIVFSPLWRGTRISRSSRPASSMSSWRKSRPCGSDPKGKNRTQEIDINYKGIGVLEMSKVTASMKKRENGTAEAIPFSRSSRCFLIGSCLAALFVLLHALTLLRQMQIQISTACANTANVHIAVDFINRIQNHVISRNILRYPDTAA